MIKYIYREVFIEEYEGEEDKNLNNLISKDRVQVRQPITSNNQTIIINDKGKNDKNNFMSEFEDIFNTAKTITQPNPIIPSLINTNFADLTLTGQNNSDSAKAGVDKAQSAPKNLLSELEKVYCLLFYILYF
jgi:hypothetical protein